MKQNNLLSKNLHSQNAKIEVLIVALAKKSLFAFELKCTIQKSFNAKAI